MASEKKKRKRRRKRRNKGRFNFLLKGLTMLAVLAAMTMGATVFFQLEQVDVVGNERYTAQEIQRISGLVQGDNLFRINKNEIKEEILQTLPYVEDVNITRRLPSTIQIEVMEWDAVARIPVSIPSSSEENEEEEQQTEEPDVPEEEVLAEGMEEVEEVPEEAEGEEPNASGEEGGEASGDSEGEDIPEPEKETAPSESVYQEPMWLMSAGGRMLEPASEDSPGILVKGMRALSPKAGTQLAVAQTQQDKLNALLDLLKALEERDSIQLVSEIDMSAAAEIHMRYDGRFLVKLPMTGDFSYCLHALEEVVEHRALNETGTMDLTRKDYAVVYSPE